MNSRNQLPPLDLNGLDKNHDIRFYYDKDGNLTRIRKEPRMDGGLAALIVIALVIGGLWWLFGA